jgi:hypothetical protein
MWFSGLLFFLFVPRKNTQKSAKERKDASQNASQKTGL